MLIGALIGWALLIAIILVVWARLHAAMRADDGIDEVLYVNGLDEQSLKDAA